MDIRIILEQLTTLFLVIGLGYFLRKINMFTEGLTKELTKLLVTVTTPALTINSVLTMEEKPVLSSVGIAFLASALMYIFLPIIGFILSKLLFVNKKQLGLYIFMTAFLNVGFMGYPLVGALLGNQGVFFTAIVNIVFNVACYTYGIMLVNIGNDNNAKFSLKMLITPGLILSVVAIIIYFTGIHFPKSITQGFTYVGGLTTPLAMLIIGSSLAAISLKDVFTDWRIYVFTAIRQILLPIALSPIIKYCIADDLLMKVILLMICVPVGNTSVLFATQYGADQSLAAKGVFISTLFSIVTIPLVIMICL